MRDLARGFVGELLRIARSPLRIALMLSPFVAWAVCVGVYANHLPRGLHVGVLDQDRTTLSRTLARGFEAAPSLHVERFHDIASLQAAIRSGRIRAGIVIPDGCDEAVREGRTARVGLLRDATRTMPSTQIFTAVSTVVATESARLSVARLMRAGVPGSAAREMALPLRLDGRPLGNPWMDYLRSFSPVLLPMFLQMGLMIAGATCATHLRRLTRRFQSGRVLAWVFPQALVGCLVAFALADTIGGGIVSAAATLALCIASAFVGLGVGRVVNDTQRVVQGLLVFNTPAFVVSGFSFPEWAMPRLMEILTRPLPYSLWLDVHLAANGGIDGNLLRGTLGLLGWAIAGLLLCVPSHGIPAPGREFPVQLPRGLRFLTIRGLSILVLLGPPLYFTLYGAIFVEKEETRVPVAVTGSASSQRSIQIARALAAHPRLDVEFPIADDADRRMRSGEVRAVIALPSDLDLRLRRGRAVAVPMLFRADKFMPASDLQRAVSEVLGDASARIRAGLAGKGRNPQGAREFATPLSLDDRAVGNPRDTYGDYMLPVLGFLIAHQLLLVAMGVVASAKRHGVESIRYPGRQAAYLYLWFAAAALAWVATGLPFLDVPVSVSSPAAVVLAVLAGLTGAAGLGATIGRLVGDPVWVLRLAAFTSYPLFFLSGASWPLEAMPGLLRFLSWFDPMSPLLDAGDRALRLGASVPEIGPALLHGVLLGLFWMVAAWIAGRVRIRLDRT